MGEMSMTGDDVIACNLGAFTKEQRRAYDRVRQCLMERKLAAEKLEDGYRISYPGDADTLGCVQEWVSLERKCCPFLTFMVTVRHEEEPITLEVTGGKEVTAFLYAAVEGGYSAPAGSDGCRRE